MQNEPCYDMIQRKKGFTYPIMEKNAKGYCIGYFGCAHDDGGGNNDFDFKVQVKQDEYI